MGSNSNNNHNGSISTSNIDSTLLQFDEKHTTAGNIFEHHHDCLRFNRCSLHKRNVIYIYVFVIHMTNHMLMITHDVFFWESDLGSIDSCLYSICVNC
jgi:hypothetical protein